MVLSSSKVVRRTPLYAIAGYTTLRQVDVFLTTLLIEHTHNLPEGAAGLPLAAAIQLRDRLVGKKIAISFSGGNLSMDKLGLLVGA